MDNRLRMASSHSFSRISHWNLDRRVVYSKSPFIRAEAVAKYDVLLGSDMGLGVYQLSDK